MPTSLREAVKPPVDSQMGWRRLSALNVYAESFGLFLFVSPWLFAYANEAALGAAKERRRA
jgi:hypothetical protein